MKSGCVSRELKAAGAIPGRADAGVNLPGYSRTGIRKSKTSQWRGAALIALNLFMVAHIIQWRLMGKTVSPIEPSETMYTLQNGFVNAGFIFFSLAILATLIFGRFVCGWLSHTCIAGFLRVAAQKNGPSSEAVSLAAPDLCPPWRRAVHVRLARCLSIIFEARARTNHPEIHQSFGNHKFLADVSFCRSSHSVSVYLRLCHCLFFGTEGLLHLCLSVWRVLWSRR